jgi:hypothetical protein
MRTSCARSHGFFRTPIPGAFHGAPMPESASRWKALPFLPQSLLGRSAHGAIAFMTPMPRGRQCRVRAEADPFFRTTKQPGWHPVPWFVGMAGTCHGAAVPDRFRKRVGLTPGIWELAGTADRLPQENQLSGPPGSGARPGPLPRPFRPARVSGSPSPEACRADSAGVMLPAVIFRPALPNLTKSDQQVGCALSRRQQFLLPPVLADLPSGWAEQARTGGGCEASSGRGPLEAPFRPVGRSGSKVDPQTRTAPPMQMKCVGALANVSGPPSSSEACRSGKRCALVSEPQVRRQAMTMGRGAMIRRDIFAAHITAFVTPGFGGRIMTDCRHWLTTHTVVFRTPNSRGADSARRVQHRRRVFVPQAQATRRQEPGRINPVKSSDPQFGGMTWPASATASADRSFRPPKIRGAFRGAVRRWPPDASAFAPQEIRRHAKADPVWRTKRRRFPAPDIRGDDARADRPPVRLSNPLFRRQATVSNADW